MDAPNAEPPDERVYLFWRDVTSAMHGRSKTALSRKEAQELLQSHTEWWPDWVQVLVPADELDKQ